MCVCVCLVCVLSVCAVVCVIAVVVVVRVGEYETGGSLLTGLNTLVVIELDAHQ